MSLLNPLTRFRRRMAALAAVAGVVLAMGAALGSPNPPAARAQALPQAARLDVGHVELSPAGPYTSGQAIQVKVQATPGRILRPTGICPDNVNVAQLSDTVYRNLTCAQITPIDGIPLPRGTYPADLNGLIELTLRAPLGLATATTGSATFPCDPDHPCRVPFTVQTPEGAVDLADTIRLTYTSGDTQVAGACGTGVPGQTVRATAPDRLSRQWIAWTVAQCDHKAPATSTAFGDESLALSQFSAGAVDLAYAGTPDTTPGFVPDPPRKALYVPVALNAMSAGLISHVNVASSVPSFPVSRPLSGFTMTAQELASLLSPGAGTPDGLPRIDSPLEHGFAQRNPDYLAKGSSRSFAPTVALAGPSATTLFLSRYLSTQAPTQFSYPSNGNFGDQAGKPFGAFVDFNGLANSSTLFSLANGVPSLKKGVYDATGELSSSDPVTSLRSYAYITDTATLGQLDVAPVALQSVDGSFVAPTTASMQAAVAGMTATPEGTLQPDPKGGAAGPYPLTYVEYAVVPGDALDCAKATPIVDWLRWVSSTGQDHLTPGLAPLTTSLRKQATERLDGFAASSCPKGKGPPDTNPPGTNPPGTNPPGTNPPDSLSPGAGLGPGALPDSLSPGAGLGPGTLGDSAAGFEAGSAFSDGGSASSDLSGSDLSGGAGVGGDAAGSALDPSSQQTVTGAVARAGPVRARAVARQVKIPTFAGPIGRSVLLPVLAIPLVGGMLSGAAWLSAGNSIGLAGILGRRWRHGLDLVRAGRRSLGPGR